MSSWVSSPLACQAARDTHTKPVKGSRSRDNGHRREVVADHRNGVGSALEPGAVSVAAVDGGRGRTDDRFDVPLTARAPVASLPRWRGRTGRSSSRFGDVEFAHTWSRSGGRGWRAGFSRRDSGGSGRRALGDWSPAFSRARSEWAFGGLSPASGFRVPADISDDRRLTPDGYEIAGSSSLPLPCLFPAQLLEGVDRPPDIVGQPGPTSSEA